MKIYKRVKRAATRMIAGAATGAIVGAVIGALSNWRFERIFVNYYHYDTVYYRPSWSYDVFNAFGFAMLGAVSIAILGAILGPIFLKSNMAKLGMVLGWVGGLIIGSFAFNVYFAWETDPVLTFAIIGMHILGALSGAMTGALVAGEIADRFSTRVIGGFEGAIIGVIVGSHVIETEAFYGAAVGAILAGIFGILGALEPRP